MSNPTPAQLQALLQYASKRLGTTPEQLAKTVQSGGLEALASHLFHEHDQEASYIPQF